MNKYKAFRFIFVGTILLLVGVIGYVLSRADFDDGLGESQVWPIEQDEIPGEPIEEPQLIVGFPDDLKAKDPAAKKSYDQYMDKGGKYIWGANDCSIFVQDYMKASGANVEKRWTTKELFQPKRMEKYGYSYWEHEAGNQFPDGTVLIYRWESGDQGWGHCGIVTNHFGDTRVMHNDPINKGLVVEPFNDFLRMAELREGKLRVFVPN
ncbi:MAG: C40 family peptidase [Armatimonadetes bacterium]|nr:C40 family peptidase [Armatimonadota bacterium]